MRFENITFEVRDRVALIAMNRPEAMNAVNEAVVGDLNHALDVVEKEDHIRSVILTGNGRAFCAGDDIKAMAVMTPVEARAYLREGQNAVNRFSRCKKPILAALNGYALGGGAELALACDFIYASEKAKFGLPEIDLALMPGFGGTQRLPRLIGKALAKELMLTGRFITADEAFSMGIVNRVCKHEDLLGESMATMAIIASKPHIAVQSIKEAVDNCFNADLYMGIDYELQLISMCFTTKDKTEGISAFIEKRKPNFE